MVTRYIVCTYIAWQLRWYFHCLALVLPIHVIEQLLLKLVFYPLAPLEERKLQSCYLCIEIFAVDLKESL